MAAYWGLFSYLSASLLFAFLGTLVLTGRRDVKDRWPMLLAFVATSLWGAALAWQSFDSPFPLKTVFAIEVVRDLSWLFFLLSVLGGKKQARAPKSLKVTFYLAALVVPIAGFWPGLIPFASGTGSVLILGGLAYALLGLVLIEQIYRNAVPEHRRALSQLCIATGALLAYDLFMFSTGLLVGKIDPDLWAARGVANALMVPLLAVFAKSHDDWQVDIFISRQAVFFSATLLGTGVYLISMALVGYYVRIIGGDWGHTLQIIFFFGAAVLLATILLSGRFRRSTMVFLGKHFYKNKYDYRKEWLRLIETISNPTDASDLRVKSVQAIAQIVGCESGTLWLHDEEASAYQPISAWNRQVPDQDSEPDHGEFAEFLRRTGWVVGHSLGGDAFSELQPPLPGWLTNEERRLLVPLMLDQELYGFIVVDRPETELVFTYEDTDLLKTAGKQLAGSISLQSANERLAQEKQFQAFNRLTAFMMHDLKNLIAQLSLVVRNAETHRDNPEFIADAIETISGSVERMNRMIAQLKGQSRKNALETVDLAKLVKTVCEAAADRRPIPEIRSTCENALIHADTDRIHSTLFHVIRNAQDACGESSHVWVDLACDGDMLSVIIEDDGEGMNKEFLTTRLFRPFDSTKGSKGMGIGAYQVREYMNELGGRVAVDSESGRGTLFTMYFPVMRTTRPEA